MKIEKYFIWSVVAIAQLFAFTSCDDDDDDDFKDLTDAEKEQMVEGTWICTDADVLSVDMTSVDLPQSVVDLIEDRVEDSLEGATITLDASTVSFSGNVMIFSDSGIRWTVNKLTNNYLEVVYDINSEYQGYSLKMRIEAEYTKIK